jgi:hypothetical protein
MAEANHDQPDHAEDRDQHIGQHGIPFTHTIAVRIIAQPSAPPAEPYPPTLPPAGEGTGLRQRSAKLLQAAYHPDRSDYLGNDHSGLDRHTRGYCAWTTLREFQGRLLPIPRFQSAMHHLLRGLARLLRTALGVFICEDYELALRFPCQSVSRLTRRRNGQD